MPYLTKIVNDGRGIVRIGQGIVTGKEILQAMGTCLSDLPCLENITHGLVDLSEVATFDVTAEEVRKISEIENEHAKSFRKLFLAIAAPQDISFGISRMYDSMTAPTGWTVNVLRSREQAVAWLRSVVPTNL